MNTTEVLSHDPTQISIQVLGSLCEWIGEDRVSHDQIYLRLTLLLLMILLPLVAAFSTFMPLVLILLPFQMQTNRYLFIFFHFSLSAHINMDFWLHTSFSNSCRKTYVCSYKACLSTWVWFCFVFLMNFMFGVCVMVVLDSLICLRIWSLFFFFLNTFKKAMELYF